MDHTPPVQTVRTADFEMDYVVFGKGKRPFIMLPGMSLHPVTLSGAAVAQAYARFTETHTVYLFDPRRNVPDGFTVEEMAEDVAAVLRTLGITDADVFGASQGGMVAQMLAIRHPALVHTLVLGSTLSRQNDLSRTLFDRWIALAREGRVREFNRDFRERVYSDDYVNRYRDAFLSLENDGTPDELHRFTVLAQAGRGFDDYESLGEIACPVLVIGSDADRAVGGIASREIADKLGCELYMYEQYGHAVYDEAPDYQDHLACFFREHNA